MGLSIRNTELHSGRVKGLRQLKRSLTWHCWLADSQLSIAKRKTLQWRTGRGERTNSAYPPYCLQDTHRHALAIYVCMWKKTRMWNEFVMKSMCEKKEVREQRERNGRQSTRNVFFSEGMLLCVCVWLWVFWSGGKRLMSWLRDQRWRGRWCSGSRRPPLVLFRVSWSLKQHRRELSENFYVICLFVCVLLYFFIYKRCCCGDEFVCFLCLFSAFDSVAVTIVGIH